MENKFRVIEIVNKKKLIVNMGTEHGLKENDYIVVYSNGRKIVDNLTHQTLGTWDIIKAKLKVIQSFQLFSICSEVITFKNAFSDILHPSVEYEDFTDLDIDEAEASNQDVSEEKIIHVGDLIRKLD